MTDAAQNLDAALRDAVFAADIAAVRRLIAAGADPFALRGTGAQLTDTDKYGAVVDYLATRMSDMRQDFLAALEGAEDAAAFLRAPYLDTGETALLRALKMNLMPRTAAVMAEKGVMLGPTDLAVQDRNGQAFVTVAGERAQLKHIFNEKFWPDLGALQAGLDLVPDALKEKTGVPMNEIQGRIAQERLRLLKKNDASRFRL